jgi:glutathione S-transferase
VQTVAFRAPRGKLPFLEDGGERITDSGAIIDYLKRRYGDPLDADLTPEQRTMGHLIRRTCEGSLYFVLIYCRWVDDEGWRLIEPYFFGKFPIVIRDVLGAYARRTVRQSLHGQGYGRMSREEIEAIGAADLSAIAAVLAKQPFAVGERPTSYDATLYGLLANIVSTPLAIPLQAAAKRHPALVAYVERMRALTDGAGTSAKAG